MALWYVSSVGWTAVAQWAATTAYSVGDLRRQLAAPAVDSERVFRCTTAGTSGASEPSWNLAKGATTSDDTVVWTEVTGNATYNWSAPHARGKSAVSSGWAAEGDRVYLAHNHAETSSAAIAWTPAGSQTGPPLEIVCVNSAGSVPPVSADLRTTASVTTTGNSNLHTSEGNSKAWFYGINFYCGSGAVDSYMMMCSSSSNSWSTYVNCSFNIVATGTNARLYMSGGNLGTFVNCTVSFGNVSQNIRLAGSTVWRDSSSAVTGATIPDYLLRDEGCVTFVLDGVDLSAMGSGKTIVADASSGQRGVVLLKNCKLGASVTVAAAPSTPNRARTDVLISDSGDTHNRQERYQYGGVLTRESTIVRTGGASDGETSLSWKVVTTSACKWTVPFECFEIAIWNTVVGTSKTVTIEIVNDGVTLKNNEIWMDVQHLGTAGVPLSSKASSRSADILAAGANVPTSTVAWTTTGLTSPVKQYLQVSITPQELGWIRATVWVAKASQTVYIDPKITVA